MQIRDRVALVTGASSGVGRRVAERLAERGARLCLLGRAPDRLEATAAACRGHGATVVAIAGDIGDDAYVDAAFALAGQSLGAVDILVNCAGISLPERRTLEQISLVVWDEMMRTNLRGTYLTCHAAIAGMKARGRGAIINIGSTAANIALPGVSVYAASKFAVRALTDSLIGECEGTGVRVSMVSPGPVNTPIWDNRTAPMPMGREAMLQPDDIADAALWLIERPDNVRIDQILLRPTPVPAV